MSINSIKLMQGSWRRSAWTQGIVFLLFTLLTYVILPVVSNLNGDLPSSLIEVIISLGLVACLAVAVILFILRFFYGEGLSDLNLKRGRWWQDVLGGIALSMLTLGILFFVGPVINQYLPRAPNSGWGNILPGLVHEPLLKILFVVGPIMAISVVWEELSRVFLLSRWWKIVSGRAWRWLGVLVSAGLWGLAHFYQGPSGMVNVTITGIILAVVYMRFGRVLPLIICHYLQIVVQIVLFVYLSAAA